MVKNHEHRYCDHICLMTRLTILDGELIIK